MAIRKLRLNSPLTSVDLRQFETILVTGGVGQPEDIAKAKQAFTGFLAGNDHPASQVEFLNLIINHLTQLSERQCHCSPEPP